jgi:hypothetical protein
MKCYRVVPLALVLVCTALMVVRRPADAYTDDALCKSVGCPSGAQKCAELSGTFPDERCEEGVMCCPFPEESFVETCFEGVRTI